MLPYFYLFFFFACAAKSLCSDTHKHALARYHNRCRNTGCHCSLFGANEEWMFESIYKKSVFCRWVAALLTKSFDYDYRWMYEVQKVIGLWEDSYMSYKQTTIDNVHCLNKIIESIFLKEIVLCIRFSSKEKTQSQKPCQHCCFLFRFRFCSATVVSHFWSGFYSLLLIFPRPKVI